MFRFFIALFLLLGLCTSNSALNILDPALKGFWKFEETVGTIAYDESNFNRDSTITGAIALNQPGAVGQGYAFNGGAIIMPDASPTNEFSFGGWMKTSVTHEVETQTTGGTGGTSGQRYAFEANHGGDYNAGVGLSVGTNGISVYEHGSNYMPAIAVYNANIGTGWNHIFITYKNYTASIYLNGVLVQTGVSLRGTTIYAPTRIGNGSYGAFIGSMDELTIWSKSLSSTEVVDLYSNGIPVPEASTLLYSFLTILVYLRLKRK